MLRTICLTFPFVVCLCWFVTFVLHSRSNDTAKRVLTVFLGTCTVLYLCHAFYFSSGLPLWGEGLWALCSLSVYPLYFVYLSHLTCRPLSRTSTALWLLPGLLVALAILIFPGSIADTARKILNAVQIFAVLYFGYRRLQTFDAEVAEVYADTEGRDLSAVKTLLVAFVATSLLSATANAVGKQNVASSEWLFVVLIPFGVLLYSLSFIAYTRDFSMEEFISDTTSGLEDMGQPDVVEDSNALGRKIDELMTGRYYLTPNLKITDLARETGACRTYVSNYINTKYSCSFSEYVNKMRVAHAKRLIQENIDEKMSIIAEMSGFSSEASFYRNFRKVTGMTPMDWQNSVRRGAVD